MACTSEFIDFVCEVLTPLGEIHYHKMMGDYVIYVNEKCIATACDNNIYVKMLPCLEGLMRHAEIGKPYEGAKECYILDLSNQVFARKIISMVWDHIPFPKKKTKNKS